MSKWSENIDLKYVSHINSLDVVVVIDFSSGSLPEDSSGGRGGPGLWPLFGEVFVDKRENSIPNAFLNQQVCHGIDVWIHHPILIPRPGIPEINYLVNYWMIWMIDRLTRRQFAPNHKSTREGLLCAEDVRTLWP